MTEGRKLEPIGSLFKTTNFIFVVSFLADTSNFTCLRPVRGSVETYKSSSPLDRFHAAAAKPNPVLGAACCEPPARLQVQ